MCYLDLIMAPYLWLHGMLWVFFLLFCLQKKNLLMIFFIRLGCACARCVSLLIVLTSISSLWVWPIWPCRELPMLRIYYAFLPFCWLLSPKSLLQQLVWTLWNLYYQVLLHNVTTNIKIWYHYDVKVVHYTLYILL